MEHYLIGKETILHADHQLLQLLNSKSKFKKIAISNGFHTNSSFNL